MANQRSIFQPVKTRRVIEELPLLMQQEVSIQRYPSDGINFTAKVLGVDQNKLTITLPRCLPDYGYLRETSGVTVTFVIDEVLYEARAQYLAENNQHRELIVDERVIESNRRNNSRLPLGVEAVYVPISSLSLTSGQLSHLKWRRCRTLDFSSGGALLTMPVQAPENTYFLLNLEIESFDGPLFVFSQLRWITKGNGPKTPFQCGLQFIPTENLPQHFSKPALAVMPPMMLGFTKKKQSELDRYLSSIAVSNNEGE